MDLIQLNEFLTKFEETAKELQELKNEKDTFYSNEEFIKLMNISKRTAQNWRDEGKITFSQIGGKIYYSTEDITIMLNNHKIKGHYAA
mgnify:CR=1 FL=1